MSDHIVNLTFQSFCHQSPTEVSKSWKSKEKKQKDYVNKKTKAIIKSGRKGDDTYETDLETFHVSNWYFQNNAFLNFFLNENMGSLYTYVRTYVAMIFGVKFLWQLQEESLYFIMAPLPVL